MSFFFINSFPDNWLTDSIIWAKQKEGSEFWSINHNKWVREYEKWLKNNEIQRK